MEDLIESALLRHSTAYKALEPAVMAELVDVSSKLAMDASTLASSFDRFMTVKRFGATKVSLEDVEAFSRHQKAEGKKPLMDRTNTNRDAKQMDARRLSSLLQPTPPEAQAPTAPSSSADAGTVSVISSFNSQIPMHVSSSIAADICTLGHPLTTGARYGADRLEDRALYMESRIVEMEGAVEEDTGIKPHPVGLASQDPQTVCIGRICCDSEEGHLNAQSVLLEGSMHSSEGARVRLDLSALSCYRIFPGQVVAVQGPNPSGRCILVRELVPGPGIRPVAFENSSMREERDVQSGGVSSATAICPTGPDSVLIAAGPFTAPSDLLYVPLQRLLSKAAHLRPAILLLAGPFVDEGHQSLASGLVEETFFSLFQTRVLAPLEAHAASHPGTKILLVPSVQDVHLAPVFPQGPVAGIPPRSPIHSVANPCTFRNNASNLTIGISTPDWLLAASKSELAIATPSQDRLAALASLIPEQRSFFPLFPSPQGLALDCSLGKLALAVAQTPALLVLPSDLAPCVKALQRWGALAVNPGRAFRGTFAHVSCTGSSENKLASDQIRVDVLRLSN